MYGERERNASREAGWLNLPGVTQVPHVADLWVSKWNFSVQSFEIPNNHTVEYSSVRETSFEKPWIPP